jgi:hypothetical protein
VGLELLCQIAIQDAAKCGTGEELLRCTRLETCEYSHVPVKRRTAGEPDGWHEVVLVEAALAVVRWDKLTKQLDEVVTGCRIAVLAALLRDIELR